jgi:starch synthase (maltosyl-transferring)
VVIERIEPEVDCGRFPAKRVVGETVRVGADVFTDGHARLGVMLRHRAPGADAWQETPMTPAAAGTDRWEGAFVVDRIGRWTWAVEAWVDAFATWRWGLARKVEAGHDVRSELLEGAALVGAAAARATGEDAAWLEARAQALARGDDPGPRAALALDPALAAGVARHPDRRRTSASPRVLAIEVERVRAAAGAWYECFPRSAAPVPGRHGTFRDLVARLPEIAAMGFDVLYLPPIHPIGRTHRKGRNNALVAEPDAPGSPWAIGAAEGGHTAVHPELGTLEDFDRLAAGAAAVGLEIALDLAFQASPDHPWVTEHPAWFRRRPDGTVQYAENPPKRYQDIYPFDFEGPEWRALWDALRDVVLFWVGHDVRLFRVDNPHTKPFVFWEWLIAEVRARCPDVVFLAEAFTRPSVMRHLAKLGFSQSYTYFTWRNTKAELVAYLTELAHGEAREYMRPNLFVNTPDILPEYLQTGGRPAFQARLVLAATLAPSYGIYGPAFEHVVTEAVAGTEEYLDSEKYQLRHWPVDAAGTLRPLVTRVNRIRREHPALGPGATLRFLEVDNPELLAYARAAPDGGDALVVVVNLDPHHVQSGWLTLPLEALGVDPALAYQAEDLLGGGRWLWQGPRSFVALDPRALPAHLFRLRRRVRTERDFDYYL